MHYGDEKSISRIGEGSFFSVYGTSLIKRTHLKGYRELTIWNYSFSVKLFKYKAVKFYVYAI